MKLKEVTIRPKHDRTELIIGADPAEAYKIQRLVSDLGEIAPEQDYTVNVHKTRRRRSKDSNAYMWELIGQLAEVLKIPQDECYKTIVRNYGQSDIVPVREEQIDFWREQWEARGIGWQTEDLGACRNTKGYHNILNYYGSSVYDNRMMHRLLEGVIDECKEQGIETLTPDEIAKMYKEEEKR